MPFLIGLGIKLLGVGRWLRSIPWQVWAGIAAGLIVWIAYHKVARAIEESKATAYKAGVTATDLKWERQQAEADRKQAAKNAATASLRADISNEVDNDHAKGRGAILARSDALRLSWERQAANRNRGGAQGNGLPTVAEAACLAHAEGYDGLSWGVAHRLLTVAQLQQQQMNDLITFVERQGAVAQ